MKNLLLIGLIFSGLGHASTVCFNNQTKSDLDVNKIIIEGESRLFKINLLNNASENIGEFKNIAATVESNPFYTLKTFELNAESTLKIHSQSKLSMSRGGCGRAGCRPIPLENLFFEAELISNENITKFSCVNK